jgi:DNA polymerase III psi subunit
MKAVLQHISDRQARFAEHPFFEELRQERPLEQALAFAPRLAFWVMSFQDVLRLNAQRVQDPALSQLMHRHHAEERGHDEWFFEDIALLMGRPLTLTEVWSRAHQSTRDVSNALIAEVLRPMDDRLRVVLVLTLEATSHVFFTRAARLVRAAGSQSRVKLKYFSDHHLAAEAQHEVFEEQLEAYLRAIELTPALREEGRALVDRVFAAFDALFDGMRARVESWTVREPKGYPVKVFERHRRVYPRSAPRVGNTPPLPRAGPAV